MRDLRKADSKRKHVDKIRDSGSVLKVCQNAIRKVTLFAIFCK